jgi:adsorption protein B
MYPSFSVWWQWILGALACLLLVSGIDDLLPLLICLLHRMPGQPLPDDNDEMCVTERRIAIFVPCWQESQVIGEMIRQNVARIEYRNYDMFIGVYPNDQPTCDAAFDAAAGFPNVHVCVSQRPGPTSKADCLNSIYCGMQVFERVSHITFDTIVLHDAEDVIHAEALNILNLHRRNYAMVQIPVLPLPTGPGELTHGIYCDEFAEFQLIDMQARQYSGSFVPSNGVGTGFARNVLELLAMQRDGLIFDPSSLTEDYDIGLQIHYAGFAQIFFPVRIHKRRLLATREFFPRTWRSAIRQRTRWITGIALQSWERHGWRGSWGTRYWFWRDRKGLITNPLSLLTNLLFLVGVTDWMIAQITQRPWSFSVTGAPVLELCCATTALQLLHMSVRAVCVGRLFGLGMGATVPLRCLHANFVNCAASLSALRNYVRSKSGGQSLRWDKTEHAYPAVVPETQ